MSGNDASSSIDHFLAETLSLSGQVVTERSPWNREAAADGIRHFCDGTGDNHPLARDRSHPDQRVPGRLTAPPAFLTSVLYPVLHGAPVPAPLTNIISAVSFRWAQPIIEGDRLGATSRQKHAAELEARTGGRAGRGIAIETETRYHNQRDEEVGVAEATLLRLEQQQQHPNLPPASGREIYRADAEARSRIEAALHEEAQPPAPSLTIDDISEGATLPARVRGPLTIGDMIAWQAAIGPSYRAGPLAYHDALAAPHTTSLHPVTGWPVKNSQQHEDFLLASQRGMPAPFDNGVMRFATVSSLVAHWMGTRAFLRSLSVNVLGPNLYGDITWYAGQFLGTAVDGAGQPFVRIAVTGTNQAGEITTTAEAEVGLDARAAGTGSAPPAPARPSSSPRIALHQALLDANQDREDAVALIQGASRFTYGALFERAGQLAHHLHEAGIAPGQPVGLLLERSPDAVAAMLAASAAARPWLPLDPDLPTERLSRMLADAAPGAILLEARTAPLLPAEPPGTIIDIDRLPPGGAPLAPATKNDPHEDDAAYLIYTSGTTGHPRGVVVPQQSLVAYLEALAAALPTSADDTWLQTASLSFSASTRQLFLPLSQGARIVMASWEEARDPLALLRLIKRNHVTVWDTVPSVWRAAMRALAHLEADAARDLLNNDLKFILLTGEALPWSAVKTWRDEFAHPAEIYNLYSQTETAGTTSIYPVPRTPHPEDETGFVPIGQEIPGAAIEVRDEHRQPLPAGSAGELCVRGNRLASGYWKRDDLTAQRFVRHAGDAPGAARLFRTGDRGRRRDDGVLEYIDRIDRQLKVLGHRVQPAEVEQAIARHPDVDEVFVDAEDGASGQKRLVAWIAPRPARSRTVDGRLRRVLPNGLAILELNPHETDFTYHAIFEERTYLKHGLALEQLDCIVDVGANIGLFALFASAFSPTATVHCIEPNPRLLPLLRSNLDLYHRRARVHPFALGEQEDTAAFTHFQGSSIQSGFHPDAEAEAEKEVVRRLVRRENEARAGELDEFSASLEGILEDRFTAERSVAVRQPLSRLIADTGIERIDLLKVNAEKSELEVLRGIDEGDWKKIRQLVVKIDLEESLGPVLDLLAGNGYETACDQDPLLRDTTIRTVYASRDGLGGAGTTTRSSALSFEDAFLSADELRTHAARHLPTYMVPARFEFLERLPRSPNGKIAPRSLRPDEAPDPDAPIDADDSPPAGSEELIERLQQLCCELLRIDSVSPRENFYVAGGDSLSAGQFLGRITETTGVTVSLRRFLEKPTLAELAAHIATEQTNRNSAPTAHLTSS